MKKRTVGSVIAVCMLLAISFYFVGGTYARYASEFTGTAKVDVAKWTAKITGEDAESNEIKNLTFKVKENTNVVEGKIAPGVTAEATAEIDLTDTEVAVEFYAEPTEGALAAAVAKFGMNAEDITFTATAKGAEGIELEGAGTKVSPYVLKLQDGAAFTSTNGKVTVTVTLKWTNVDDHNTQDTAAGKKATEGDAVFEVPFTLHVQQYIAAA